MTHPLTAPAPVGFSGLGLPDELTDTLQRLGYHTPTPIQIAAIPVLGEGKDLLGRAPTGTGKTAAFGLPLLARIQPEIRAVQAIVLTPTRELAIQVAEALQQFSQALPRVRVLAVYGGQEYGRQIRELKSGTQIVVGTPGRIIDHLNKGTLKLDQARAFVLDEADEMLRMGFIDDVEHVLQRTPDNRQIALFSATMPPAIRRIAQRHLNAPEEITIQREVERANDIRQRVWRVQGTSKLEALARILECETSDGVLVFVRTRQATLEVADALSARGLVAVGINGDMAQSERERTVNKLKAGTIKVLVATDVVARGLDVDRITHVINYDVPFDAEAYVHRIGRTGRAGRRGEAILFVTPREQRLVKNIERVTRSAITPMQLPDAHTVNQHRVARFLASIDTTMESASLGRLATVLEEHATATGTPMTRIAAALAHQSLAGRDLFVKPESRQKAPKDKTDRPGPRNKEAQKRPQHRPAPQDVERFRAELGHSDGVKASHLVGAIANEAGIDSAYIGKIKIHADHSIIELPQGMPKPVLRDLRKAWVLGKRLNLSRLAEAGNDAGHRAGRAPDRRTGGSAPPKRASASNRKRFDKKRKAAS